jgi:adenylate cyclase
MLNATELLKALPADVRLARMEALVDASQQLNRTSGLSETLYSILELVSIQLGVERVTVFLFDERSGKLHARQMTNRQRPGADEQIEIVLEPGKGLAGYVAQSGESLLLNDVRADARFDSSFDERTGFVTRTMLCVPLHKADGKLLGALQAINLVGGEFSMHDLAYLEAFASIATVAVEREQLTQASCARNYSRPNSTLHAASKRACFRPQASCIFRRLTAHGVSHKPATMSAAMPMMSRC